MFRYYDHLQVDIYTLEVNTTDNGSVVFKMLVITVHSGDRFLVTVETVAVVKLTTTCSGCTWRTLILVLSMFLILVVSWLPLVSKLAFSCSVVKCVSPSYVILHANTKGKKDYKILLHDA
jgi:hypothetical protein